MDDTGIIAKTQEELKAKGCDEQTGWHWKKVWHGNQHWQITSNGVSRINESLQIKVNNR